MVENQKKKNSVGNIIMWIIHSMVVLFAVYVSFNCNDGFNLLSFLAALVMPYIYLIWIVFKNGLEMCGALNINKIRF
jgi:ABC-type polysaccharide/polyol phosphate export permease